MKTLRHTLLEALKKHGEMILDDIQSQLPVNTRGEIFNELTNCKRLGYVTSRKDDVTKLPAYKVTEAGKNCLVETAKKPAPSSVRTPPVKPARASKEMPTADTDEIGKVRERLALAERQRDEHFADLENARGLVSRLQAENADLTAAVHAKDKRIEAQDAEIQYKAGVIADLTDKVRTREQPPVVVPAAYAVARPGKPLRRFKKDANAQADAMASARAGKAAEVFALLPVGRAVPGAEWRPLEAA